MPDKVATKTSKFECRIPAQRPGHNTHKIHEYQAAVQPAPDHPRPPEPPVMTLTGGKTNFENNHNDNTQNNTVITQREDPDPLTHNGTTHTRTNEKQKQIFNKSHEPPNGRNNQSRPTGQNSLHPRHLAEQCDKIHHTDWAQGNDRVSNPQTKTKSHTTRGRLG